MLHPDRARRLSPAALGALLAAACGAPGGSGGTPLGGTSVVPDLLACRSRVGNEMSYSEIALRSEQNLGTDRVSDRSGIERRARLHPDGVTVVFARERQGSKPESRELFTSTVDGSHAELRLTLDSTLDDEPCWSPTGEAILFASERNGAKSLWLCERNGSDPRPFLLPPAGQSDGEPDWAAATDRVVFVRGDEQGVHRLWLAHGDGTGAIPFTDGGSALGAGLGDRDPAFTPDGSTVAFARRLAGDAASLCTADVTSGAVTVLYQTVGAVGLPRYTPQADRLFFGLSEPEHGRGPLRLAVLPAAGGTPVLVWPDERYRLEGLDVLPGLPAAPIAGPAELLDVTEATVTIPWGTTQAYQTAAQLATEDGNELLVGTVETSYREAAGVQCAFELPVADPLDTLELRCRVIARVDRFDGDSVLRLALHNPVDGRNDTVVELPPQSAAAHTLTFTTTSLRHVTREGQIRVSVIADLAPGDPGELHVDLVEVVFVPRAEP